MSQKITKIIKIIEYLNYNQYLYKIKTVQIYS